MESELVAMHSMTSKDVHENASSKQLDNLALNTHKAGMQNLDAGKINEIIQKASKGSRFYQHKQQAQQRLDTKIEEMLQTAKTFSAQQIQSATDQMEHAAQKCEAESDLSRTIVHVDMDMFFAAVEMRDNPSLGDVPMAVGDSSMLSTSNYAARKFGVRAAMPGFIALKLCPQLVLVPPNFSQYKAVSKVVEEVFAIYDSNYVMMSLDEAYLDITQFMEANRDAYVYSDDPGYSLPEAVVSEMRLKIQEATQLTASAGIAPNTRLAKVCSDLNKPNGQYYLPPDVDTIKNFVHTLSIRKISGIGNVMEQQLKALDIRTCGDLRHKYGLLRLLFSESCISYFVSISLGVGETDLTNMGSGERKSISTETTFTGTTDRSQLLELVASLCRDLHQNLVRKRLVGKVVAVKMKTVDFALRTRSLCLGEATQDLAVMTSVSRKILMQEMQKCSKDKPLTLRLLGVRMSTLSDVTEGGEKQVTISMLFARHKDSTVSRSERETSGETHKIGGTGPSESEDDKDTFDENVKTEASEQKIDKLPNTTRFVCPVCDEIIPTKFLKTFNNHIDECLNKTSSLNSCSSPLKNVPEISDETRSKSNNATATTSSCCSNLGEADEGYTPSFITGNGGDRSDTVGISQSLLCSSAKTKPVNNQSLHSTITETETDTSASLQSEEMNTGEPLLCPVCCSACFSSSLALNRHLDECLSLQEVAALHRASGSDLSVGTSSGVTLPVTQTLTKKRKPGDETKHHKKHKSSPNYSIMKYLA